MSDHLDLETLAELADGALPAEEASRAREHLAGCRSCTAAYADAVRYRAAWLAQPDLFVAPREPARALARGVGLTSPPARAASARGGRGIRVAVGAAGVALLAAGLTWLAGVGRPPMPGLALPAAVREGAEWSSSRGLVLPGGEHGADRPSPELRSGRGDGAPGVEREADSLIAIYERGERSPAAAARVVLALLVANDLDAARDYAREGLRDHPDDVRLTVLAADVSYRGSDLEGAEHLLRRAHARAPRDPIVALDLALVARQRGDTIDSRVLLERVSRGGVPALAARARSELRGSR